MAAHQHTLLFSPGFQQVLDGALGLEIRRIDRVLAESHLSICRYEHEEEPFGCSRLATVTDLHSERELCVPHFRAVSHG